MQAYTFEQFLSHVEKLSEIGGICTFVWAVVGFLQKAKDIVVAIPAFMQGTTESLNQINNHVDTAVTNHLTHIESGIGKLSDSYERLTGKLGEHIMEMSKTQAVILDRLPQ